jgi:hypothetical protein
VAGGVVGITGVVGVLGVVGVDAGVVVELALPEAPAAAVVDGDVVVPFVPLVVVLGAAAPAALPLAPFVLGVATLPAVLVPGVTDAGAPLSVAGVLEQP